MKFAYLIEPPFNHRTQSGKITGCDVELAKFVFAELGIDEFEPVETEFAELLPGASQGRWRMTTGLFATDERRKHASFSRPIWALPDGLLVRRSNPLALSGYRSVAQHDCARLAVIRDQYQHRSAIDFGISEDRIVIFETYTAAAKAVLDGSVDAYASVGRAHSGYIEQLPGLDLEIVVVPEVEKAPAFGCFGFSREDKVFRESVDAVLKAYLGTFEHRRKMAEFGFSDQEVDLVVE